MNILLSGNQHKILTFLICKVHLGKILLLNLGNSYQYNNNLLIIR